MSDCLGRLGLAVLSLWLSGCAPYARFTLPPAGGEVRDVIWEWTAAANPVLARGTDSDFDASDALNPSIVAEDGRYLNFYSGWDGKSWRTGLAESLDGTAWTKKGPFLAPGPAVWEAAYIAANGSALKEGDTWSYWYQAGSPPSIGLARSADRARWEKQTSPVLTPGPRGAWDERGVADPYVVRAGGILYMYFLGQDRARRQRLGVATSTDGVHWTKHLDNPILEIGPSGAFDELGLGEPAVWGQYGRWWMLYTGRDRKEWRRMGLAVSEDGVRWRRVEDGPVIAGKSAWNEKVVCDAEVELRRDGTVRVWFGGGDRPEPAENLHGQIGVGQLRAIPRRN